MRKHLGIFALLGLMIAAEPPKEDTVKREREQLQGTWKWVAAEVDGKKVPEKDIPKLKWVIGANKITWSDGNEFLYAPDPSKKPKQIDFTYPGPDPVTINGIYALDGDELKICFGKKERPADFTTNAGSRRYLYVMKREKQ